MINKKLILQNFQPIWQLGDHADFGIGKGEAEEAVLALAEETARDGEYTHITAEPLSGGEAVF